MKSGKESEAWANHLPPHWKVLPLRHCVTIAEGPGILAADFVGEGVPLIRIAGLGNRKATLEGCDFLLSELVERKWAHLRVQPGDLLISGSASSGLCCEVDEATAGAVPYTGIFIIRPRGEAIQRDFARWFFLSDEFLEQAERARTGSAIQHFGPSHLSRMSVALPPAREQRAIASYLDGETARLDGLVAEKERVLELLAEKRRALIAHAVTRGLDRQVELRDSGIPWLGAIPAHWNIRRLAWLFRERDERGAPELPLLEVSISAGVILREFSDERIETTAADFNTYKVARAGDVVFNKMRMWQGAVGVAPEDGLVSPDYVVAAPTGGLLPDYAGLLFRTDAFSAECARRSHGIVWDRLRLYWEGFREIEIPLPTVDEQASLVAYVAARTKQFEGVRAATTRTIALLRERRTALIAAAVTGRIDVTAERPRRDNEVGVV